MLTCSDERLQPADRDKQMRCEGGHQRQHNPHTHTAHGPQQNIQTPGQGVVAITSLSAISSTFHSLFKVLFIFPSRYLFAIGLSLVFSFR